MAKLIDDMRVMRARQTSLTTVTTPERYIEGEGGPCPFCDGRRKVSVYLHVQVRARSRTRAPTGRTEHGTALPGFWQGSCRECALEVVTGLGERGKRRDYIKKLEAFLGKGPR
jgi:hypothetical protein